MTENTLKWLFSIICGFAAAFFDQYGFMVILVAAAVVLDFITGVIKSKAMEIGLDSKIARKGFWKKIALFAALAFGIFLDLIAETLLIKVNIEFDLNTPFALIISSYIVINECISIAENLYLINPNCIPAPIARLLKVAKSDIGKDK